MRGLLARPSWLEGEETMCGRCGRIRIKRKDRSQSRFCLDCRAVDPEFCEVERRGRKSA